MIYKEKEISNCELIIKNKCPLKWDSLENTSDENIKFCNVCEKKVYYCLDEKELITNIKKNRCIAVIREYEELMGMWESPDDDIPDDELPAFIKNRI